MTKLSDLSRTILLALACSLAAAPGLALPTPAQEEPPTEAEPSSPAAELAEEIVEIEHADPDELARVLRVFDVQVRSHPDLGLITLQGPPNAVAAARAAAVQLDRPPEPTPSIQVNVYVLDSSKDGSLRGGVPPALEPIATQLRDAFGFDGVELIDTLALRVLDGGEGQVKGTLPESSGRPPMPYELGFNRVRVVSGERTSVRLEGFGFWVRTTGLPSESGEAIRSLESVTRLITDLEVRTGQKAVVGKAATAGAGEGLIVVIEATVIE